MPARKQQPAREPDFGNLWPYEPAVDATPPEIPRRFGLFIGGRSVPPKSRRYYETVSPRDEGVLAGIPLAGATDVDAAYRAAAGALPAWRGLPGSERGKLLFRVARLLQDRAGEFAAAETLDSGMPIKETTGFVLPQAAAQFFYHAGWADKLAYLAPGAAVRPLGVVGQILAWDMPLLALAANLAPALAAGNTVVLKPAEATPVTALKFAAILEASGVPPGVVNIVTGGDDTGAAVVTHPLAAMIAFSGSAATGKAVQRVLAGTDKRLALRLGGSAVQIICDDAPLDQAVEGIIDGVFRGQRHGRWGGARLLVQEPVAATVLAKLRHRLATLRTGDPLDRNTDLGALPSRALRDRVRGEVARCAEEGPPLFQPRCELPEKGWYFPPTVISGVALSHRAARGEIPGPVLAVLTFRTPKEAADIANNNASGLAAGVWTDKGARALQLAAALKAGAVWANTYRKFDPAAPFGGGKESGFAPEGGRQGMLEYLQI